MTRYQTNVAALAAVAIALIFGGPEWLYVYQETIAPPLYTVPALQHGEEHSTNSSMLVVPCETDTDCATKNPTIRF